MDAKGLGRIGLFTKILYAPDFAFNLVAVNEFSENKCKIMDGHKNCIISIFRGSYNLFCISSDQLRLLSNHIEEFRNCNCNSNLISTTNQFQESNLIQNFDQEPVISEISDISMNDVQLLIRDAKDINLTALIHNRLGHANVQGIISSLRNKIFTGINVQIYDIDPNYFCSTCPITKSTIKPIRNYTNVTSELILGLIYTDLCGPYGISSKGGNKYMITFTDHYSKYVWIYFLKEKSQAVVRLEEFHNYVTCLLHCNILCIRSDSGGEYISNDWKLFCTNHNISLQYSSVYTRQQNGTA